MGVVKTYSISVEDFPAAHYVARSPGQARARAWREYGAVSDCSFKHFLGISSCMVIGNRPPVGTRIMVSGLRATHCGYQGQYVAFMRDDSDAILLSHPSDVSVEKAAP